MSTVENKCDICGMSRKWKINSTSDIEASDRLFLSATESYEKGIISNKFKRNITTSGYTGYCAIGRSEFMVNDKKCEFWQADLGYGIEHHISIHIAEQSRKLAQQTKFLTFAAVFVAVISIIISVAQYIREVPQSQNTPSALININL